MPELAPTLAPPTTAAADRLSPPRDRDRLDLYLAAFLARSRRRHVANPHLLPLYNRAAEFALHGGKRLRPRLCLASYRICSGRLDGPPRPVWLAAASLELFHAFMLVHDDLIDGSLTRRDRLTLHEAIRCDDLDGDEPGRQKRAADLGLVAGDLLFSLGMRLLSRAGLDDAAAARANRLVADMLFETGLGEALDILYGDCPLEMLDEAQLVEAYHRKTARYSVSGPLVLGATLAGAPGQACRALRRFGDLLGLAYQLKNDLDALDVDPIDGDHPDLDAGKRTLVLWTTHGRLGEPGRRDLADALDAPAGPDRRIRLLGLIRGCGAVDVCLARLRSLQREAVDVLREAGLDPAQRRAFIDLTELLPHPARPTAHGNGNGNGHHAHA